LVVPDVGASDHEDVIEAFFDLADAIITVCRLIGEAWTLDRWDGRRQGDHNHMPIPRS
jgi:hypothetical protein